MGATVKSYKERAELLGQRTAGELDPAALDEVDAARAALVAADRGTGSHEGVIRREDGEIWVSRPGT